MRTFVATLMILSLCAPAVSEVRFINGTGLDLKFDILHQSGQVAGIAVGPEVVLTAPVGPKTPFGVEEMAVVKSADGTELYRETVTSGGVYVIKKWNPIIYDFLGHFKGAPSSYTPKVINATGQKLMYKATMPDFSLYEYSIDGPDSNCSVSNSSIGNSLNVGDKVPTEFGFEAEPLSLKIDLVCGALYLATKKADGSISIDKIGVQ